MITNVGKFADIQPGQTLQLTGFWKDHTSYSQQFEVTQYKQGKPATLIGIEKYLSSGLIKGIGSVTAKRIVAQFGLESLDIIDNQIERLAEVPGIAKKRIKHFHCACQSQKLIKEVMEFLKSQGISTTYAVKIYKQYGDKSIVKFQHRRGLLTFFLVIILFYLVNNFDSFRIYATPRAAPKPIFTTSQPKSHLLLHKKTTRELPVVKYL